MVKKSDSTKQKVTPEGQPNKEPGLFSYLRFGESYTSLILGIIVVIIATAMLLSFVHNKNAGNTNVPIDQRTQNTVQVSQQAQNLAKEAPVTPNDTAATIVPTDTVVPTTQPKPTLTPKPTTKPKSTAVPTKSVKPTVIVKATIAPKKQVVKKIAVAQPTAKPTIVVQKNSKTVKMSNKNVWVVKSGESLWIIAQQKYTNGNDWVYIARANNLSNPSDIHVGDRLALPTIPSTAPTIAKSTPTVAPVAHKGTTQKAQPTTGGSMAAITGNSYTVMRGDNLWNIAVRAYGDGFKWTQIAQANHLADPRVIHSGNVFIIPR